MHVYICACMRACACMRVHASACVCMRACMRACTIMLLHACSDECVLARMLLCALASVHARRCSCARVHLCVCLRPYVCKGACANISAPVCACMRHMDDNVEIHLMPSTAMGTHTCTYTHTLDRLLAEIVLTRLCAHSHARMQHATVVLGNAPDILAVVTYQLLA